MGTEIISNVTSELLLVGAIWKDPALYLEYGGYIRPPYDFSDPVTRFFYDTFEIYYKNFSEMVDATKVNTFMSQSDSRLKSYAEYGGWKTLEQIIRTADPDDTEKYFNSVKKYSLLREYQKYGFPVDKIMSSKNFENLTATQIYQLVRAKADQIHTVISCSSDMENLLGGDLNLTDKYLEKPEMGKPFPWEFYDTYFLGIRPKTVLLEGALSNEGKTRKVFYFALCAAIEGERVLFLANEMDKDSMLKCMLTTAINNECFRKLHGVYIDKPEREIALGLYRNDKGNFIIKKSGETPEEYIARVYEESEEYRQVKKVEAWLHSLGGEKLFFVDCSRDYSDKALEAHIRKAKAIHDVTVVVYDLLKCMNIESWDVLKLTATRIKELANELSIMVYETFQLRDEAKYTPIPEMNSNLIGASKGIKHTADEMVLTKKIDEEEYSKYAYLAIDDDWGDELNEHDLQPDKTYYVSVIDKNRVGATHKFGIFEVDLNLNRWIYLGELAKKVR